MGYQWMAHESSRKFAKLHIYVSLPGIVVNTALGTVSFSSLSADVKAWVGFVNLGMAIWSGIQSFVKFGQLRDEFAKCALTARHMSDRVQLMLIKPREDREGANEFMQKLFEDYSAMASETPSFPNEVRDQYFQVALGKRSLPDIFLSIEDAAEQKKSFMGKKRMVRSASMVQRAEASLDSARSRTSSSESEEWQFDSVPAGAIRQTV